MTSLNAVEFTTCKLIWAPKTSKEAASAIIEKYTSDFTIANHYEDHTVGCNRIAFTVVDMPTAAMKQLFAAGHAKDIDLMESFSKKPSNAECCSSGGCGCSS